MKFKYEINCRLLLLAALGFIMVCSSYLIFIYDPLQMIIKKIAFLGSGTIFFQLWSSPPYLVTINVYIFNVTNKQAFLDNKETLRFNQIGPYVYQETLSNTNAVFYENGTMSFAPRRALTFLRHLSVGDPSVDRIMSPNIPLIGITASLQDASMITNLAVSTISNMLGSKPFVNVTVSEYLWGYDDRLVTLANKALPTWINFNRFGIMDRLMALDNASNIVTLNLHPDRDLASNTLSERERKQLYHIHRWNGSPGLRQWGYKEPTKRDPTPASNNQCNMVEGAFEGTIFPYNIVPNSTYRLYRRAFCRPVPLQYEAEDVSKHGFAGYRFRVRQDFLYPPPGNPDNACYCYKDKCLRKGLGTLAPCYYDMPVVISQPHFYNADPWLVEQVAGMQPNRTLHDTTVMLFPPLGIPLTASLRIQINLDVGTTKYNSRTARFNNLVLPLFWLEMKINDIPNIIYYIIVFAYYVMPALQKVLMMILAVLGMTVIVVSVFTLAIARKMSTRNQLTSKGYYAPILPITTQYFQPELRARTDKTGGGSATNKSDYHA